MSDPRCFHVSPDGQVSSFATAAAALAARASGGYVWIDLVNPTRDDLVALAEPFGLHPLAIEDCLDDEPVPKIEVVPAIHSCSSTGITSATGRSTSKKSTSSSDRDSS